MFDFDWGFWVIYLPVVALSMAAGWWLRGVKAEDDARRIEQARWKHPSTMQWDWEDR